jgi:hypothetical protein
MDIVSSAGSAQVQQPVDDAAARPAGTCNTPAMHTTVSLVASRSTWTGNVRILQPVSMPFLKLPIPFDTYTSVRLLCKE